MQDPPKGDILDKLRDLHKQATTERSHYYVAASCNEAIAEIERLRRIIARCVGASLEWSSGVRSAQETCAEVRSTLMAAVKLPHQPST